MDQKYYLFLVYGAYFTSSVLLSFLINSLFLKFVSNLGMRNTESLIRWSSQAKPSLGGISFFLIFLLSIAVHPIFFENNPLFNKQLLGIVASCTLAFLM